MKCKIPEISWHNRDPVLSVDIQQAQVGGNKSFYRLASGGTDTHVLIWYVELMSDDSDINLDLVADLSRHQRAVNCVKWSPNGELLASGDDESVIFIWKQKSENEPVNILDPTNEQDKEVWITLKILRGHMEDVYDLSWAPNSQFLVSGSVDNSAIIWDINKGKSISILNDHKGFVQGVAWDPKNQYIATLSTDRHLRIFDIQTKKVIHRISKGLLPALEGHELYERRIRYFHDDTLQTFFRRLCFTPDGKFLLTPSGITDYDGVVRPINTLYVFSRYALRQPSIMLPFVNQYTVAVRCSPILYKLRKSDVEKNPAVIPLPYRMIFAVATKSSVYFYDTQQNRPFAVVSNIHYTRLTDVTWSHDGRIVIVSSTDGFCSLITFEKNELGEEYEDSKSILENLQVTETVVNVKRKKQKENDNQTQKGRKASTDDFSNSPKVLKRNTRLENVKETNETRSETKDLTQTDTIENSTKEKVTAQTKKDLTQTNSIETSTKEIMNASNVNDNQDISKSNESITTGNKLLSVDIILDKEILSSDEKFESPEKKSRPATPISIRRHPRTPNSMTPTLINSISEKKTLATDINKSPMSSLQQTNSPHNAKRATPIAVRRTPRTLIKEIPITETPAPIEEAMDAWPVTDLKTSTVLNNTPTDTPNATEPVNTLIINDDTAENTENIRLVYEETIEEKLSQTPTKTNTTDKVSTDQICESNDEKSSVAAQSKTEEVRKVSTPNLKQQTPNNKTPRRVSLKTISTPKSKKKL
ncbi:chromatin assembly factor 1 subunit B-like [Teleopsis dalmanni]|uniref:chromatin assembly factor 1 subunit B-like n=1 Tax=Teleopsis dalmanni TaxID=139649 RepID=UPI0018CE5DFE|nr:chromatin assembly factor 1 subunit B-like [Teleopsis dalmanni]